MSTALITEARSWVGTPYVHQAATKGAGCDCLGFIRGLWRFQYGTEPETPPAYTADWSEPQGQERLWAAALRHLVDVSDRDVALGDVLLFRMRSGSVAKHLGLVSATGPHPHFIHAYTGHGVTESPLSAPWERRIAARFAFQEKVT